MSRTANSILLVILVCLILVSACGPGPQVATSPECKSDPPQVNLKRVIPSTDGYQFLLEVTESNTWSLEYVDQPRQGDGPTATPIYRHAPEARPTPSSIEFLIATDVSAEALPGNESNAPYVLRCAMIQVLDERLIRYDASDPDVARIFPNTTGKKTCDVATSDRATIMECFNSQVQKNLPFDAQDKELYAQLKAQPTPQSGHSTSFNIIFRLQKTLLEEDGSTPDLPNTLILDLRATPPPTPKPPSPNVIVFLEKPKPNDEFLTREAEVCKAGDFFPRKWRKQIGANHFQVDQARRSFTVPITVTHLIHSGDPSYVAHFRNPKPDPFATPIDEPNRCQLSFKPEIANLTGPTNPAPIRGGINLVGACLLPLSSLALVLTMGWSLGHLEAKHRKALLHRILHEKG